MKRNLLILILPILLSLQLKSQNFPLQGSEWWHAYFNQTPPLLEERGYVHTWVDGDSTVNGTVFQRLRQEIQYKSYTYTFDSQSLTYTPSDTILNSIQPLPSIFVYTTNDSVYFLDKSNKKQFVWYNNPTPGDIWNLGKGPKYQSIQDSVNTFVKVNSVTLEPLNGIQSKTITFTPCDSLGNEITSGSVSNLPMYAFSQANTVYGFSNLLMYVTYRTFHRTYVGDEGSLYDNRLICFNSPQTSHIKLIPEFQDCYGLITFSNKELDLNEVLSVFPNPATSEIWIKNENQSSYSATLLDINGRILKNIIQIPAQSSNTIPLQDLSKGLYILVLTDKEGKTQTHKIIKQ